MEKIITVKQEPVDDNTVIATSNAQARQASPTVSTQPTITLVKVENVSSNAANNQGGSAAKPISIVQTGNQPSSPQVQRVLLSGSPVKITQIKPNRTDAGHVLPGQTVQLQGQTIKAGNVTLVQVQKVNPATKQKTGSPSKQGQPFHVQKILPINLATTLTASQTVASTPVTMAASSAGVMVRSIAPKVNIAPAPGVTQTVQLAPKPTITQVAGGNPQGQQHRFIIPAPNISTANTNIQFPHGVISGGVVYLPQQALASGGFPIAVPLTANTFTPDNQQNTTLNGTSPDNSPPARPRKPCNCTKSQCLKLYCDCFAQGEFCNNCNCINCSNNMDHEKERSKAIKACLDRNPHAFHPKIGKGKVGESERRHNKGCHCKRSGCLKNYCECYEAKILCTSLCKCTGCKNFEESPERKTLMHLADAAEVRVNQQNAAKTKLESQIEDLPTRPSIKTSSGERLPFSFVTNDVAQATCQCLVAQASEAEKVGLSPASAERMILEEFGRSLLQIIHTASKTKAQP